MLYNAKNGTLKIGGSEMDYIRFGTGERILVMLPGLGDGLRGVKGTALPMASEILLCKPSCISSDTGPGLRLQSWASAYLQ